MYARHANDREQIGLFDVQVFVKPSRSSSFAAVQVGSAQTRVELPVSKLGHVALQTDSKEVKVGRFLNEWKRRQLRSQ